MLLLEVRRLPIIPCTLPWLLLIGEVSAVKNFQLGLKYLTVDVHPNTMQVAKYTDDFKICAFDFQHFEVISEYSNLKGTPRQN